MKSYQVNSDRYFFTGAGIWFVLIVFFGFSPTFYLKQTPEELPFHLNLHGSVFTCWVLLFFCQTCLISARKVRIHMAMGIFGLFLIVAMIPIGFYPILFKVSAGTKSIDLGGYNLFGLTAAYIFALLGLAFRKKPFYHKRLMLFATLVFAMAATDRIAVILALDHSQLFRKSLAFFPSIALFVYDFIKLKSPVWFDLSPVVIIMLLFFYSDYFWLAPAGESFMQLLIGLI